MKIRTATEDDIDDLLKIENACFSSDIISRERMEKFVMDYRYTVLVYGTPCIGYCVFLHNKRKIYSLAVLPEGRGQGLGKRFLNCMVKRSPFLELDVRANNTFAINLYEEYGFLPGKCIENYYKNGDDALRMFFYQPFRNSLYKKE